MARRFLPSLPLVVVLVMASCKGGDDDDSAAPPDDSPLAPRLGSVETATLDCEGAYELPAEFLGEDGLGHHGWTVEDLEFTMEWGLTNAFVSQWISDDSAFNDGASVREQPWKVPNTGYCFVDGLRGDAEDIAVSARLGDLVQGLTGFAHPEVDLDGLYVDVYVPPDVDLAGGASPTARAILGLLETANDLPGAPEGRSVDDVRDELFAATAGWPAELDEAVGRLVLALGEAYLLKLRALEEADLDAMEEILDGFLQQNYASSSTWSVSPSTGDIEDVIYLHAPTVDRNDLYLAGMAVAAAADAVRVAATGPVDGPPIDVATPHGRVVVHTGDDADEYSAEDLADVALLIDLGGDDVYHGRYASTRELWMSASVVIDIGGDDQYSPETPDIEAEDTTAGEAFDNDQGFTQGAGLLGVGVLIDAAGDDTYAASSYAQGSGMLGVGILLDVDGRDRYRLANAGQGAGFLGIGALVDATGDDDYGVYTTGQGSGRPWGQGTLLDLDGQDTYIAYYNDLEPWLPGPGFNNYFGLSSMTWPYSDDEGNPHYMSNAQGIGWGFRGDWFDGGESYYTNWMGGFGALVDLGDGDDTHLADCMSMGQGFVYGWGLLYDDGGDDVYRTFWWGPAAAAHMGVGTLIEEDGNDDIHTAWASSGFGYDRGIAWHLDHGGDDTYSGKFYYGYAYECAMTFMFNIGGDDVYNADGALGDAQYGIVRDGCGGVRLMGAFMDLGGGQDEYNTTYEGVGNDAVWYSEPTGSAVDPNYHKGIGIDR